MKKKPENVKELENYEVLLYRHSDGYPDGVLPELEKFLKFWEKARGITDTEYCGARLLQYMCNEMDGIYGKDFMLEDKNNLTGIYSYGICKNLHGDIEYYYAIYPSAIDIYEQNSSEWSGLKLLKTINI